MTQTVAPAAAPRGWIARSLDVVERVGNRLPDPVVLFLLLMLAAWLVSWWLSGVSFTEIDPRTGQPVQIKNQLAGESLTAFMSKMVGTFTSFPPLGVVLVAMLGLGVAEHTGFISAVLRAAMSVTPRILLTPALIAVGILSHVAVDAGYVLVIPLGAVIFYAAGRHPLAGIAAAFAGVSGGFTRHARCALGPRPAARGPDADCGAARGPDGGGEPAQQLRVHDRLLRPDHRRGLGADRPGDRASPARHARGRGPRRTADAGAARAARAPRAALGRSRGRAGGRHVAADGAAGGHPLGGAAGRGRAPRAAGDGGTADAVDRAASSSSRS